MICVKRTLDCERIILDCKTNGSATLCLISFGRKKILAVSLYLPPSSSKYAYSQSQLIDFFLNIIKAKKLADEIIIYGDFNFPTINWSSWSSSYPIENAFLDILEINNLRQIVNFSTAATEILDLILTSKDVQVIKLEKLTRISDFTLLSNQRSGTLLCKILLVFAKEIIISSLRCY